jgi:single-strand DNA-binding protein
MALNQVAIDGRIIDDFELRKTKNKGLSVVNFRLLHNSPKQKNPVYIDVEVWGKEAENLAANAGRGTFVVVHAELRRDRWDSEEGVRSKLKLTANRVMVDPGKASEQAESNLSF